MASILPRIARSMRIIALPLVRANLRAPNTPSSASHLNLTYYHFQIDNQDGKGGGGIVKWAATKTADLWADFGKGAEGSWKLKLYRFGERLEDRIDFEELALRSIDPSLGPKLSSPDFAGSRHEAKAEDADALQIKIPLIYPPSTIKSTIPAAGPTSTLHPSLVYLKSLLDSRTPRHRNGFYTWAIIAPFTAPFKLIPLIPNLPFLFCAWRSWSHYRAYRASQYLSRLLPSGAILPHPSSELDKLYAEAASRASTSSSSGSQESPTGEPPESDNQLLLTRDAIPQIISTFGLPSSAGADMYRAIEQARMRIAGGRSV